MKNFKMRDRLIQILLTGALVLTSSGCNVRIHDDRPVVIKDPTSIEQEQPITTEVPDIVITPSPTAEPIGTVTLGPDAEKLLITSNGLTLVRTNNHLELLEGNIITEKNNNPLYSYYEQTGRAVTTTEVNFRLVPQVVEGTIIDTLDEGTELDIIGKTDNNWYLAKKGDVLGFISGDYIRILTYDVYSDYELTENVVRVVPAVQATTNVKIREQATTESKQLDLLRENHSIKMIRLLDNGWYEVEYAGGINGVAYVCGDYVKETIMVQGNYYKVGYLKNDAYIYDAPNGNVTGIVPQYESGEIYSLENGYYLVSTDDAQVGYIKKGDMGILTDTAVVVDISAQTLTVYSNNQIVLTSPIVSGKDNEERHSDIGCFSIRSKETDRYLTDGSTYNSHVNYWMPYNGGEGLHDATWRSRFGGDIYKTNGSHGCINLPLEKAKELYNIVHVGDTVLVKR